MSQPTAATVDPSSTARLEQLRRRVDAVLGEFIEDRAAAWPEPVLNLGFTTIRDFILRPGKRIRPIFCYWGWRGAGASAGDDDAILRAAAALELFHVSALVHDDLLDLSESRRGLPAVHRLLADVHARSSWRGDARRFGRNAALLTGNLCLLLADELLATSGLEPDRLRAAWPHYRDLRTEVMCGRLLEQGEQAAGNGVAAAMRVIHLKTTSYTVMRPLQIGAALAGADRRLIDLYGDLAVQIGEAFQLRDDYLDVFCEHRRTASGLDDIRNGKPTVLIALTRERSDRRQRSRIGAIHGNPSASEGAVEALRRIMIETGAKQSVEDMILERESRALDLLDAAPIEATAKRALRELILLACRDDA